MVFYSSYPLTFVCSPFFLKFPMIFGIGKQIQYMISYELKLKCFCDMIISCSYHFRLHHRSVLYSAFIFLIVANHFFLNYFVFWFIYKIGTTTVFQIINYLLYLLVFWFIHKIRTTTVFSKQHLSSLLLLFWFIHKIETTTLFSHHQLSSL